MGRALPLLVSAGFVLLALGAGIHHVGRDNELKAQLEEATAQLRQLQAVEAVRETRRLASYDVVLANVPASDLPYQVIMRPQFKVAR